MRTLIVPVLAAAVLAVSCGEKKHNKASTDIVNMPATADSTAAPAQHYEVAQIEFEKTTHDFGTITQGEIVEYAFQFRNPGKTELLIASAGASCGCTVPDYPKEPIPPGGTGKIKVKFNSDKRIERFQKEVYVSANTEPMQTVLTISGMIVQKPDMRMPDAH